MNPSDYDITNAMQTYGGSFVQTLGLLYQKADRPNRDRLKAAFPEYWAEYRDLVILRWRTGAHKGMTT